MENRPYFLSVPMWMAWLVRGDIRRRQRIHDQIGQKWFVAWWLVFGKSEYPSVWGYEPTHSVLAMEPVNVTSVGLLPNLLHLIWLSRPDLQSAFPLSRHEDITRFLCWYRLFGPVEYDGAVPLPPAMERLIHSPSVEQPWATTSAVSCLGVALWESLPSLQERFNPFSEADQQAYLAWLHIEGSQKVPSYQPMRRDAPQDGQVRKTGRKGGVNLIGFAHAEFGLGEDVRMTSRALEAASVPHVIIDVGTPLEVRGNDRSRSAVLSKKMVYATNIFCMSAFDTAELYLRYAEKAFRKHNIGFWPWELPRFPSEWKPISDMVDEIWAATSFQVASYEKLGTKVALAKPSVLPLLDGQKSSRRYTKLRSKQYVFIYPFDPKSYLSRKNPQAAVNAFKRAFPAHDRSVKLILRVNGVLNRYQGGRALIRQASGDSRIVLVQGTLDRASALQMVKEADCLISPHRSEGFGRNIVEALILGTPVIATSYSGPNDYLKGQRERLSYRLTRVLPGSYPHGDGQLWAMPSVPKLASSMKLNRQQSVSVFTKRRRSEDVLREYHPATAGRRYAQLLSKLWLAKQEKEAIQLVAK